MGACTFGTMGPKGERDVQKAYRQKVEAATYEHGHDPYNGTISTTHGVKVVEPKPQARSMLHALTEPYLDGKDPSIEKWQNAGAIAVADEAGEFDCWYFFGWAAE